MNRVIYSYSDTSFAKRQEIYEAGVNLHTTEGETAEEKRVAEMALLSQWSDLFKSELGNAWTDKFEPAAGK